MTRLIVHADDFGLSDSVNDGIEQAWREGCLTSTSIMPTATAFEDAAARARGSCAGLDVGVHLTLVEERPLSDPAAIPSLVGRDGRFLPHATVLARHALGGRVRREEVRLELEAQLRRVLDAGLHPSHFDSHQHTHLLAPVRDEVARLARHHGIDGVRLPLEPLSGYMTRGRASLRRLPPLLVMRRLCRAARLTLPLRTDGMLGFVFGGRLDRANLQVLLENLPADGVWELMCHPGRAPRDSRYAHWGYRWADELRALTDPDLPAELQRRGVVLATWGGL